jgi:hypothetical protein
MSIEEIATTIMRRAFDWQRRERRHKIVHWMGLNRWRSVRNPRLVWR